MEKVDDNEKPLNVTNTAHTVVLKRLKSIKKLKTRKGSLNCPLVKRNCSQIKPIPKQKLEFQLHTEKKVGRLTRLHAAAIFPKQCFFSIKLVKNELVSCSPKS